MKNIKENLMLQKIYFYILPILLICRDLIGVNYNKFLLIVVCSFFMLIANYKDLIYLLIFTIPFLCGIPGTYIFLIGLLVYILKYNNFSLYVLEVILYISSIEIFSMIRYSIYDITLFTQYIVYLSIMFFLVYSELSIDYEKVIKIFIFGLFVVSFIILVKSLIEAPSNWLYLFSKGWYRLGDEYKNNSLNNMLISLNANNLALFCIKGIFLTLILFEKNNFRNKYFLIIISYFVLIGFLTQSRTFLIVLFLCGLLYFICNIKNFKILILLLFFIAFIGIMIGKSPEIITGITTRLSDSTLKTAGGRTGIIIKNFEYWTKNIWNILFGTGIIGYKEISEKAGQIHNGFLQILFSYGVIGFNIFLFTMLKPIIELSKQRIKFVYYIPIISIFIFIQTIQFLNPCFLMFSFLIGVFSIKLGKIN